MTVRNKLLTSAIVAVAALSATAALADGSVLKAGDVSGAPHWYGRAGGLVGSDRVAALRTNAANPGIAVNYDRDVAARTNMATDRISDQTVTVTYDRDVAQRTNMGLRETAPVQAAGAPAAKTN
jgi:hypothetical protein